MQVPVRPVESRGDRAGWGQARPSSGSRAGLLVLANVVAALWRPECGDALTVKSVDAPSVRSIAGANPAIWPSGADTR
eukprot:675597-Alexandrium_andersonii.AAC.1